MWNFQHIFIWRQRYLQIFKSALMYLWANLNELINFCPPRKSSENLRFSDDFRGNRSWLIHLNLLNIRGEIWRRSLNRFCFYYETNFVLVSANNAVRFSVNPIRTPFLFQYFILKYETKGNVGTKWLHPFHITGRFLYPLKTENFKFPDGYRGYIKRLVAWNRLTLFTLMSHFYIPWKRQETKGFLAFSGGV